MTFLLEHPVLCLCDHGLSPEQTHVREGISLFARVIGAISIDT